MKRFRFAALLIAVLAVLIYLTVAVRNGKTPDLPSGIIVFIGVSSVLGAARLICLALVGQSGKMTSEFNRDALWRLSSEDAALMVIGGIALGWVSVQAILESFSKVTG